MQGAGNDPGSCALPPKQQGLLEHRPATPILPRTLPKYFPNITDCKAKRGIDSPLYRCYHRRMVYRKVRPQPHEKPQRNQAIQAYHQAHPEATITDIATVFNLSRTRVYQIIKRVPCPT